MLAQKEYVKRVVGWLVESCADEALIAEAWARGSLDGVYAGKSKKIHRLVRLAFKRGVIRGASCAWEAQQPVVLRTVPS